MAWETSDRRSRLPQNWDKLRRDQLRRDNFTCQHEGCSEDATDVDHIDPKADDHTKLQSLCRKHHAQKSSREGGKFKHQAWLNIKSSHRFEEVHPADLYRNRSGS